MTTSLNMTKKQQLEIIWLASYPKSGNTWLRFFLTCLIKGRPKSSADVLDCVPELGSGRDDEVDDKEGKILVKTHLPYSNELPRKECTAGFLYIIRNPLDLILSAYNYHLLHLGSELIRSEQEYKLVYMNNFLHAGFADSLWKKMGFGTWHEHLNSWLRVGAGEHPYMLIRYEDMLAKPYLTAERITSYLNLDRTTQEIQEALEFSTFKNMKAMEEKEIQSDEDTVFKREVAGVGHQVGKRFMNIGKSNQYLDIPLSIREKIKKAYAAPMKQFGYY